MAENEKNLEFDGAKLVSLRQEQNLSQATVARAIGIKPQSLCGIEKNKHNPSAVTLMKLCSYFNVKPQTFARN